MQVYLSSYRLGPRASVLQHDGGTALIVMNALDMYTQRLLSWDREVDDLARLGYRSQELDLREYWEASPGALERRLQSADLVWVVGGDAFVLARAATEASLKGALAQSPALTYAGYSAGACVASVDLRGIDLMDDESLHPPPYRPNTPAETLGLVKTRIVPHAGTEEADAAAAFLREENLAFVELRDGDDWLYEASA